MIGSFGRVGEFGLRRVLVFFVVEIGIHSETVWVKTQGKAELLLLGQTSYNIKVFIKHDVFFFFFFDTCPCYARCS